MKMSDFEVLPVKEQLAILYTQAVYIGKIKLQLTKLLFQLESFYVEICYTSYRKAIHTIRYSDSITIAEPYLEQIPIEYAVM